MASSSVNVEETSRRTLSASDVRAQCVRLGFDLVGLTDIRSSGHEAFLREWLAAGRHGEMSYLSREDAFERRVHMDVAHPELRSAIVLGIHYANDVGGAASSGRHDRDDGSPLARGADGSAAEGDPSRGIIARYAHGRDYHKVIRKKLIALLGWLEENADTPLPLARACVDTSPVLERELGQRAGLGWFGRSTMLLHPKHGSYFFLATLLVELEFDELDAPFDRDHCGTCNACVDACPTGALLGRNADGAPVIDATRCISYLTIENRGEIPRELRPLMGNRVFGCDICQEVCPWNAPKFVQIAREPAFAARAPGEQPHGVERFGSDGWHPGTRSPSLVDLMSMDAAGWEAFSRGSPLRRAGRAGFLRNVAVALGNWGSSGAVPVLAAALADPEPMVRGHAAWALGGILSSRASAALAERLDVEDDPWVREELELALARSARSGSSGVSRAERRVT
ncbi:MAG: tRNA epoxyqueuosine(34) reductase QueG [Gemmatimonadetes bacterium]|nr:tRNA epoxyqueuosine(34) reductase QueG [Gemmatimonadota bacterium]